MNIEQAIEQWLNLCPCKDLIINNENYFNPKNNFNRIKSISLYYKLDDQTLKEGIQAKKMDDWIFEDYEE